MLVFWDQRLVFLATPKTGSTALAAALEPHAAISLQRPPVLKHTTVQRYHRFLGPYLKVSSGETFSTIALMREPIDWLGSWYRFRQRPEITDPRMSTRELSFEDFAQAYCARPQPGFANVGSQARFLTPEGREPVDEIFCYERMEKFIAYLEERLSLHITLPQLNISPPADLSLTAATRSRLEQVMAADFTLYAEVLRRP